MGSPVMGMSGPPVGVQEVLFLAGEESVFAGSLDHPTDSNGVFNQLAQSRIKELASRDFFRRELIRNPIALMTLSKY